MSNLLLTVRSQAEEGTGANFQRGCHISYEICPRGPNFLEQREQLRVTKETMLIVVSVEANSKIILISG